MNSPIIHSRNGLGREDNDELESLRHYSNILKSDASLEIYQMVQECEAIQDMIISNYNYRDMPCQYSEFCVCLQ